MAKHSQHREVSQLPVDYEMAQITDEVMVLPLGGCDTVLGVKWLKKCCPVMLDFNQLSLIFTKKGKTINIQVEDDGQ